MSAIYQEQYSGAIGIDLGTTTSCVAVCDGNTVEIISNDQGNRTTPSYVSFQGSERLIGDSAKTQVAMNPSNTVFDAKRLIGRKFTDEVVQKDLILWPFRVIPGENDKPMIQVNYLDQQQTFSPEQISAMVLLKMKQCAEEFLGKQVTKAVVTVPAYFNNSQRQATKDAGTIAGLDVIRIINEPTAAALAYGLNKKEGKSDRKILIFDLGGGTFDVSVLEISTEDGLFEVLATNGNTHLGGEDFDSRLVEYCGEEFKRKHKMNIYENQRAVRRLRTACERAKRNLSVSSKTIVQVDALMNGVDFSLELTRAKFEQLNQDLFRDCFQPVKQVLLDSGLDKSQIDDIVLVGGSSRIPKVRELLSEFFNGKELCSSVNPDEAVAYGAAVQAAVLMGTKRDALLVDVTPLSLGIETSGSVMTKLIEKNSKIPCKKTETFTTFADNQPAVTISVYQGERALTKDNHKLGSFNLENIPLAPRGVPKIEVTFEIDVNGIMTVSAKDISGGNSKSIKISNEGSSLSAEEIKEMLNQAKAMEEEDAKILKAIQAKNKLESYIFQMKSTLSEEKMAQRIGEKDVKLLKEACDEKMEWMEGNQKATCEMIEEQFKELEKVCSPVMSRLYSNGSHESESTPKPTFDDVDVE